MTKKHPIPYFVKKTLSKSANAEPWMKGGKEAVSPAREEILEAIKLRLAAKKKKKR